MSIMDPCKSERAAEICGKVALYLFLGSLATGLVFLAGVGFSVVFLS